MWLPFEASGGTQRPAWSVWAPVSDRAASGAGVSRSCQRVPTDCACVVSIRGLRRLLNHRRGHRDDRGVPGGALVDTHSPGGVEPRSDPRSRGIPQEQLDTPPSATPSCATRPPVQALPGDRVASAKPAYRDHDVEGAAGVGSIRGLSAATQPREKVQPAYPSQPPPPSTRDAGAADGSGGRRG